MGRLRPTRLLMPRATGLKPLLERDGFVHFAAVGAAGTVHIGIIRIDGAAVFAAEDFVLGMGGAKAAAAHFRENADRAKRAQAECHINDQQAIRAHGGLTRVLVAGSVDGVLGGFGTVCQVKIIWPTVICGAGANRAARASIKAC